MFYQAQHFSQCRSCHLINSPNLDVLDVGAGVFPPEFPPIIRMFMRFQLGVCPHFLIHPKPPRIDPCVLGNRRVSPQVHKEQPAKNRYNPLRKWWKHPAPFSIAAPLHVSNLRASIIAMLELELTKFCIS